MKGYYMLKNAIVSLAVDDYRRLKFSADLRGRSCFDQSEMVEIESFLMSDWGMILTGGQGEYIVSMLRKEKEAILKGNKIYDRFTYWNQG